MRDPFDTGELALLRDRPHQTTLHLAVHKPRKMFSCSLKTEPTSGQALSELEYENVTYGAFGDVEEGMTLWVSGNGDYQRDKGWLRIRKDASGTLLYVAEAGDQLIDFEVGDYLTVVEDYRLASKYPRYTESNPPQWYMDYEIAYTDQHKNFGPQAVMGPGVAMFLEANGAVNVPYYGSRSKAWTPGSALSSYLWTFPDATTNVNQGSVGSPVYWDASQAYPDGRWTSFRVTDDNADIHTGRRLVFTFERTGANAPYEAMVIGSVDGGWESSGYRARIRVLGEADINEFPVGAHVILFEEARYGNTPGSLGGNYSYRENTVIEGWIREDTIIQDDSSGWVEFEIVTSCNLLKELQSYPVALNHVDGTPSKWMELKDLTLDLAAFHVLRWRSTVLETIDTYFADNTGDVGANTLMYQDLEAASLFDQVRKNYAEAGLGNIASDWQSSIWMQQDAQVASTRWPQELFLLEKGDRVGQLEISERHNQPNSQFIIYGATLAGEPIGSSSPGDPFGYEGETEEVPYGLAFIDQNEANAWCGNLRAQRNNQFPRVIVQMAGYWRIDAVPQSYVLLTTVADDTKRGVVWTNKRMLVREYRCRYDPVKGTGLTEFVLEPETEGFAGSSIVFPEPEPPEPDPPRPEDPPGPVIPDPPTQIWCWAVAMSGASVGIDIVRTKDMEADVPVWESCRTSGIGVGESIKRFELDPFTPGTKGYVITEEAIYYSTNLNASDPDNVVWTETIDLAGVQGLVGDTGAEIARTGTPNPYAPGLLRTTFGQEGFLASVAIVEVGSNEFDLYVIWTDDVTAGPTGWQMQQVATSWLGLPHAEPDLLVGQVDASFMMIVFGQVTPYDAGQNTALHYTNDGPDGAWASDRSIPHRAFQNIQHHTVRMPFFRDSTQQEMMAIERRATAHAWKSTDQGATWFSSLQRDFRGDEPTFVVAGGPLGNEGLEEAWTEGVANYFAAGLAYGSGADPGASIMRFSHDINEWITIREGTGSQDYAFYGWGFGIWPYDSNYQWVCEKDAPGLLRTTDAWQNSIIDWTGNMALFAGDNGFVRYIRPVWTAVA